MGVISFYRGNLHKVPDTPRRWPIPKPSISLHDFKILLEKRSRALERLQLNAHEDDDEEAEGMGDNDCTKEEDPSLLQENKRKRETAELEDHSERATKCSKFNEAEEEKGHADFPMECEPQIVSKDGRDDAPELHPNFSDSAKSKKSNAEEMDVDSHKQEPSGPVSEDKTIKDAKPAQEILSTEEEMKKRSQVALQTSAMNMSLPSQGEATVDVGSHTKQAGRRVRTELNCYGDLEEGELEDVCTPSPHSHNLHVNGPTGPLGSVSGRQPNSLQQPSPSSQQLKTSLSASCHSQHNTTSSGLMPSPSLLGAHGSHTQNVHIPSVSVSAAQIGVSSPSPATSSGTSIFRDTRRTSPSWNQR
ncbi:uncharacterized protein LOC131032999 isoform X2 [Cryptomeria japonica]|uniref:uncharacterized protein LOC131032999 isoform X2 n=1 Tax=Cryptomeria japonica TaxID=3369 RepID=UPI0027DA7057|nr:uncharacterized protein LOC131032999 isoform X2 [Cryptomeria japonica]